MVSHHPDPRQKEIYPFLGIISPSYEVVSSITYASFYSGGRREIEKENEWVRKCAFTLVNFKVLTSFRHNPRVSKHIFRFLANILKKSLGGH